MGEFLVNFNILVDSIIAFKIIIWLFLAKMTNKFPPSFSLSQNLLISAIFAKSIYQSIAVYKFRTNVLIY